MQSAWVRHRPPVLLRGAQVWLASQKSETRSQYCTSPAQESPCSGMAMHVALAVEWMMQNDPAAQRLPSAHDAPTGEILRSRGGAEDSPDGDIFQLVNSSLEAPIVPYIEPRVIVRCVRT